MLVIFENIIPIFLLIVAGNVLRRTPVIRDEAWPGLEQLCFWFLYPALQFTTIVNADFSGLALDTMLSAIAIALALMIGLLLALWPLLKNTGIIRHSQYSSVFQTAIRWNGFMALAVAQNMFPPEGSAVVALVMAVIMVPVNIACVFIVTRFADQGASWSKVFMAMAKNPLIVSGIVAVLYRFLPIGLYPPLSMTLDLVGRAALGMGLLVIGAGLRPGDLVSANAALWIAVLMKLIAFPVLLIGVSVAFGISGPALNYLALCAAVPTAMNGYLLARQIGGDAPLYASTVTMQTILAFFTIPLVMMVVGQVASG
ncbi:AEC family transporter [Nitratireductor indicus]|uniref:Auxin efflux carrier family protein n=1 Tax=Nitratireductor indicus C115 TaxID=1231190 RepID=K2P9Q0_9HYPH|nr:AEC family transporter [Nitratireductor indicus]EKF43901.1 auxin efflux carrier family protein [Nitratireductor indicus C115]MDS1135492.1 AEC family transporter [Nitratireductor indicus]SFQ14562.1 hypothetical protein SAMN05216176_101557 [Nitratireductor indicus]